MSQEAFLAALALLLLAGRLAAEVGERIRLPPVVVEIVTGAILGPTALGLIHPEEPLHLLGELGAILLLFEVGLHIDVGGLRNAQGPALRVAFVGIALPFIGGTITMRALGEPMTTALFIGGAITATSVGVTARVFSDMRALTSVESRTVIGAAVADDVGGLVILAIVSQMATGGSIDAGSIATVTTVALGALGLAVLAGGWLVPRILDAVGGRSRSDGAPAGAALPLLLGFAASAAVVGLAPIIGAFVAGTLVARSTARDQVAHHLAPLARTFVPVFFVLVGAQIDLGALAGGHGLLVAVVLSLVAISGKVASGIASGRGGDGLLVGLAMVPRGEVGLVFAGIGVASGVLTPDTNAALIAVVLVTTLLGPLAVRARIRRLHGADGHRGAVLAPAIDPAGTSGLVVSDEQVELAAAPRPENAASFALRAAALCATRRPGPNLLGWLRTTTFPGRWDGMLLLPLLRAQGVGGWRVLAASGALAALLPEVDEALRADPFDPDPTSKVERLAQDHIATDDELVRIAALMRAARVASPRTTAARLGLNAHVIDLLVKTVSFIRETARNPLEDRVLDLAAHLGSIDRVRSAMTLATAEAEGSEAAALLELGALIERALADAGGEGAAAIVDAKRAGFAGRDAEAFIAGAPWRYIVATREEAIIRHARMAEPRPRAGEIRLEAEPVEGGWSVHVVAADEAGIFARIVSALADADAVVTKASAYTWSSSIAAAGIAVDVFDVRAPLSIDWEQVRQRATVADVRATARPIDAALLFDDDASPWYTRVKVRAPDRPGLLADMALALSTAGINIHSAVVQTHGDIAIDTFEVTTMNGRKLGDDGARSLWEAFEGLRESHRNTLVI